jgi:hypothetical protein
VPDFHADVFGEAIQLLLVSIDRILHSALCKEQLSEEEMREKFTT